jgi:hypothetical protein
VRYPLCSRHVCHASARRGSSGSHVLPLKGKWCRRGVCAASRMFGLSALSKWAKDHGYSAGRLLKARRNGSISLRGCGKSTIQYDCPGRWPPTVLRCLASLPYGTGTARMRHPMHREDSYAASALSSAMGGRSQHVLVWGVQSAKILAGER